MKRKNDSDIDLLGDFLFPIALSIIVGFGIYYMFFIDMGLNLNLSLILSFTAASMMGTYMTIVKIELKKLWRLDNNES